MKLIKSPLNFKEFFVLESKYNFVSSEDKTETGSEIFGLYDLNFDFMTQKQENGEVFVFTKININEIDKPLPGYVMLIESVTIFEFKKDCKLSEKEISDLLHISGLSIAINNLRNYISNMTMYFPFGKFQLPAIDIKALHVEKRKIMESKSSIKKKK